MKNSSDVQKLAKRGAYIHGVKGGINRGGTHTNKKKELSRNFCRREN